MRSAGNAIPGRIRHALAGRPTFWASENGHEIGVRVDAGARVRVTWDPVTGRAVAEEIKR